MMEAFNDTWNYLDEFSGYGGFHLGLEKAGFKFGKCFYSEINKYAIANYAHNFKNSTHVGSITDVSRRTITERIDLITFGWPCQDNSIAGKRKGQVGGTRSWLLYEATRTVNEFKPRLFLAENVEGLRTVNKGIDIVESFRVLAFLNESLPQYDIEMQLLNTRWFLPQNRERLFFVGHLRGSGSRKILPIGEGVEQVQGRDIIIAGSTIGEENTSLGQRYMVYDAEGIAGCLKATEYKQPMQILIRANTKKGFEIMSKGDSLNLSVPNSKTRRGRVGKGVAQTLDTQCNQGVIDLTRDVIRKVTPTECERLQGLPDNWTKYGVFDGLKKEISDTQRYKLTGNGVSIPVVEAIGKKYLSLNT